MPASAAERSTIFAGHLYVTASVNFPARTGIDRPPSGLSTAYTAPETGIGWFAATH
jgi:hypothetical protein